MSTSNEKREVDTLLWNVAEHPLAIETPWPILEEIHSAVQDGFRRLSRGGVEVGGVLFGRHSEGMVRVLAWRPIACEHFRGPAFLLSNPDQQALMQMLEAAGRDPQLQVLEPVGWFVSHTRLGLRLTEDDIEIYNRFFQEPWQVSLVYCPHRSEPAQAGFFVRGRDGRIRSESSYQEFTVDGVRAMPPAAVAAVSGTGAAQGARGGREGSRSRSYSRWAWVACALLACALALFAVPKLRQPPAPVEPVQLRLQDAQGQLRVEWDRTSAAVQQAEGGTLFLKDGGALAPIELDKDTVQRGSLTYARLTEDVSVRLVLKRQNQPPQQEFARYVGSPVPKTETRELRKARQGREVLYTEARRLREEMQREAARTQALEKKVQRLERELESVSRKKR